MSNIGLLIGMGLVILGLCVVILFNIRRPKK